MMGPPWPWDIRAYCQPFGALSPDSDSDSLRLEEQMEVLG